MRLARLKFKRQKSEINNYHFRGINILLYNFCIFAFVLTYIIYISGCEKKSVDTLIAELKDENFRICNNAIHDLVKIGSPAIEPLTGVLIGNDKSIVRSHAAEALGQIGDARAVETLIDALKNGDWIVSSHAAEALGKIRDTRAVEPLIASLKWNYGSHYQPSAAEALGEIGDKRAVEPLLDVLSDNIKPFTIVVEREPTILFHNEKDIRKKAAEALSKLGDSRAASAIVFALEYWDIGKDIAEALQKWNWQPQSVEDKVHYFVALRDKSALLNMWEQTKKVLLNDIHSKESNKVDNAIYAFFMIGREEIVPVLIDILNSNGNKRIADVFVYSGHKDLHRAARGWFQKNGYIMIVGQGTSSSVRWDSQ